MNAIQESFDFTVPTSDISVILAEEQAQGQQETYEQLTIPYDNEGVAVLELLNTLGGLTAKKAALAADTRAILEFNDHDPEDSRSYMSTPDLKRVPDELYVIQTAIEFIESNDGDVDSAIQALRDEYRRIDSRLPDDVLVAHTGYRGAFVQRLIEASRDPFNSNVLVEKAKDTRGLHVYGMYGNALNWLHLNAYRISVDQPPVAWNGPETNIYWDETVATGMVAPAHDYVWLGHVTNNSRHRMAIHDFVRNINAPYDNK